jgi:hypothetical protein
LSRPLFGRVLRVESFTPSRSYHVHLFGIWDSDNLAGGSKRQRDRPPVERAYTRASALNFFCKQKKPEFV